VLRFSAGAGRYGFQPEHYSFQPERNVTVFNRGGALRFSTRAGRYGFEPERGVTVFSQSGALQFSAAVFSRSGALQFSAGAALRFSTGAERSRHGFNMSALFRFSTCLRTYRAAW